VHASLDTGEEKKETACMPPTHHLILGVTGGIATGKTTVANMLEACGAPAIDFDVLARRVVEPDKPAWKDIVAHFGEQVLLPDRTLDRKKLSGIVFRDEAERKKLEGFIHPRTGEEYVEEVARLTTAEPNAVIQAVIPLLFEANMQDMFDKILLVYAPRETQIERLVLRDEISEEEAGRILDAQLPIDEKLGLADFVVNNEKGLNDTRRQVEDLWQNLKKLQKKKG
jgi:dephospho-CoA kinase